MASVIDVVNTALLEQGGRIQINSLNDNTPAANAASRLYTQKIQGLLRAAPWVFARKQTLLTQLKATIISGALSDDPPPQPWMFSYARPADCLRVRFLMPYMQGAGGTPLTTAPLTSPLQRAMAKGIPFVDAVDLNSLGQPVPIILTDVQNAQIVYTADLSQYPDLWDPLFMAAATAMLASYFINALARDLPGMQYQIGVAKSILDQARAQNGNESISNADNMPDWLTTRLRSAGNASAFGSNPNGTSYGYASTWDPCGFPGGIFY